METLSVSIDNLRKPGEVGLQESDLLNRMPDGETVDDPAALGVRLVSLGCFCGPKLSFKKIGRGSETLPFDWLRTRLEGILHFLRNDFEGFYHWDTMQKVPNTGMTIFRGYLHSFWHDNPTDPAMQERYNRRIQRFKEIDAETSPVLFVRAASVTAELAQAPELLSVLKQKFGKQAFLLMILDFQVTAEGAAIVDGHPDILIYYLSSAVHAPERADGAPYTEPVKTALDWALRRQIKAMHFVDMETIVSCADQTDWGLSGLAGLAAFEDAPSANVVKQPYQAPLVQEVKEGNPDTIKTKFAVESELMEGLAGPRLAITDDLLLVSLGCFCGPKLTFQAIGRGAETLPFDWTRTSLDGLLHFIRNDFEGFYNFKTVREVPNSHMVMFRSKHHSFWHDDPRTSEMREKYDRRILRFKNLAHRGRPMLFVRAISALDELLRADELLNAIQGVFGDRAGLMLIVDFQAETLGTMMVEGLEDLLVYFLGSADRDKGEGGLAGPYATPVKIGIDWMNNAEVEGGSVSSLVCLRALAPAYQANLADFGNMEAVEPQAEDEGGEPAEAPVEVVAEEEVEEGKCVSGNDCQSRSCAKPVVKGTVAIPVRAGCLEGIRKVFSRICSGKGSVQS
eukprot:TRINITY_DN6729_c0_g1_i1.p1 TRINITY_DN6729_c0_g1~~TRINITY_DN6729_c0_g1_i1.p1  ORF type:complete len:653 (-),score=130.17 TRINITY_DN6729_c0_g1_i1:86-1954(-)